MIFRYISDNEFSIWERVKYLWRQKLLTKYATTRHSVCHAMQQTAHQVMQQTARQAVHQAVHRAVHQAVPLHKAVHEACTKQYTKQCTKQYTKHKQCTSQCTKEQTVHQDKHISPIITSVGSLLHSAVSVFGVWLRLFMGLSPVAGHLPITWEPLENSNIASVLVNFLQRLLIDCFSFAKSSNIWK